VQDVHLEYEARGVVGLEDVVELNEPAAVTQPQHHVELVDGVLTVPRLARRDELRRELATAPPLTASLHLAKPPPGERTSAYTSPIRANVIAIRCYTDRREKRQLSLKNFTRHRASTSVYSLTFRVRVTTPTQYGRNGTASLKITSRMHQARRFHRWRGVSSPACVVHAACGWPGGLPLGSATHF